MNPISPYHRLYRANLKTINQPVRTEVNAADDITEATIVTEHHDRRKKRDRRQRNLKPLLDLRSGDRRRNRKSSIDIMV